MEPMRNRRVKNGFHDLELNAIFLHSAGDSEERRRRLGLLLLEQALKEDLVFPRTPLTPALPTRRRFLGTGVFTLATVLCARTGWAAVPAVRSSNHNDADLHLFVDDEEVDKIENLKRELNRPRKHSGPVLVADRPWEGERAQAWGSVILEPDGRLRMWYFAFNSERRPGELDRGGYALAQSKDGLRWDKPELGVVEFRGNKKNNLFYTCAPDGKNLVDEELARRGLGLPALDENGKPIGVLNNLDGLTVVRDEDEADAQKRYKLIANMQDHRMWAPYYKDRYPKVTDEQVRQARAIIGQYVDTSPDGIHWSRRPRRVLGAVGDYMMVTRDHRNKRWWLNERASGQKGRNAALRTSKDLVRWSPLQVIFGDGSDPAYGKDFEWHGGIKPFNYGNLNLGFLERWPLTGFGAICELVCQREGKPWKRVAPGVPFLDVGPEGSFDRALIYPTHNAPIRIGDRLHIYYTGGGVKTDAKKGIPMAIGLATIGVDRFAALACWRSRGPGRLLTKPVMVNRPRLEVNVESFELQPVRVAVCSEDGMSLPGFGLDDSQAEYDHSKVYTTVWWKNRRDLTELRGKKVRLRFEVRGAALYSFRFTG